MAAGYCEGKQLFGKYPSVPENNYSRREPKFSLLSEDQGAPERSLQSVPMDLI